MASVIRLSDYQETRCRACGAWAPYNVHTSTGLCVECELPLDDILDTSDDESGVVCAGVVGFCVLLGIFLACMGLLALL